MNSTISADNMTAHIAAGRATPWTQPLGPDQQVPVIARLDGAWYVVAQGSQNYQLAPDELVADLTRIDAALALADQAIATADAGTP